MDMVTTPAAMLLALRMPIRVMAIVHTSSITDMLIVLRTILMVTGTARPMATTMALVVLTRDTDGGVVIASPFSLAMRQRDPELLNTVFQTG